MTLELTVPSMACSACAITITNAIQGIDPSAKVEADPKTKVVKVETEQAENVVKNAIASAGYPIS